MNLKTLFRPVGEKEMILIIESQYLKFPPRLAWQPIFYPVLNEKYATQIAYEWNTNDEFGNYLGFVTQFSIREDFFATYEIQNVGDDFHNEIWVSSEDLETFNNAIIGKIEIINVFKGALFSKTTNSEISAILEHFKI